MNYNFLYQKLSQRIEKLRKDKGMTQEGLAEKAGLHRAYFWDIENGRKRSAIRAPHQWKYQGLLLLLLSILINLGASDTRNDLPGL